MDETAQRPNAPNIQVLPLVPKNDELARKNSMSLVERESLFLGALRNPEAFLEEQIPASAVR